MSENAVSQKRTRNCRACRQAGRGEIAVKGHQCPNGPRNNPSNRLPQNVAPLKTLPNGSGIQNIQLPPPQSPVQNGRIRPVQVPVGDPFFVDIHPVSLKVSNTSRDAAPTPPNSQYMSPVTSCPRPDPDSLSMSAPPHPLQPSPSAPAQTFQIDPALTHSSLDGSHLVRNSMGCQPAALTPSPPSPIPTLSPGPLGPMFPATMSALIQHETNTVGVPMKVSEAPGQHVRSRAAAVSEASLTAFGAPPTLPSPKIRMEESGERPPSGSATSGHNTPPPGCPHSPNAPSNAITASSSVDKTTSLQPTRTVPQDSSAVVVRKHAIDSEEGMEEPPKKRLEAVNQGHHISFITSDKDRTDAYSKRTKTILSRLKELSDATGAYAFFLTARPETLARGNTKIFCI
ncbi:hypothetical protein M422DRAFT_53299 [Sphaerobolus stellatus SS14]|uniref:Uncharacterized protein n=1 Tax=Sphaerobolus stellatus (strain SS14) TaxID=990650 RepID=A0A0C9V285_SPHS4|nr:hypothetical protein M422DRAFT_53299 [Sphaerobolus stellatus SS14]